MRTSVIDVGDLLGALGPDEGAKRIGEGVGLR